MSALEKLLKYKKTEPKYVLLAFEYANEYADAVFFKGLAYGLSIGVITTLAGMTIGVIFIQP